MTNQLNSGSLSTLKLGEVLLTRFRKVSNGFISVELAEVKEGSRGLSAAYVFNKSDNRFSRNSARRAWQNGQLTDLEEALGVKLDDNQNWTIDDNGYEVLEVNILNPVAIFEGKEFPMRVQIQETTTPNEWQSQNVSTAAKRKGADGDYIMHKGNYIFTNAEVKFSAPEDVFLEADVEAAPTPQVVVEENVAVDTSTGEIFS